MWTNLERIRNSSLLEITAAVFLLFRCLDRPLHVIDVARLLEIDRAAARSHILLLISLGLLARPRLAQGFTLTREGRHFLLGKFSAAMVDFPPVMVNFSPAMVNFSPPVNTAAVVVKDSDDIFNLKTLSKESLTTTAINKLVNFSPGAQRACE